MRSWKSDGGNTSARARTGIDASADAQPAYTGGGSLAVGQVPCYRLNQLRKDDFIVGIQAASGPPATAGSHARSSNDAGEYSFADMQIRSVVIQQHAIIQGASLALQSMP